MSAPPNIAKKIIQWSLPIHYLEMVEGDLEEAFNDDLELLGERQAKMNYWGNALGLTRKFAFKNKHHHNNFQPNPFDMFKNYVKIAFRTLSKNLGYTGINVLGLAVGLACCFLITLYVKYEMSYEHFHANKNEIYRLIPRGSKEGNITMQVWTPPGLSPFLKDQFQEVVHSTRYTEMSNPLMQWNNKTLPDKNLALADAAFFEMFSFDLVGGNKSTVLDKPNAVLVSESIAQQFFDGKNPIGEVVRFDDMIDLEITGVFQDLPGNTHMEFDYIVSFPTIAAVYVQYGFTKEQALNNFNSWNYATFLQFKPNQDIKALEASMSAAFTKRLGREWKEGDLTDWLQPLLEIHFTQGIRGDYKVSKKEYVFIFSAVAAFILLIACFNFMNLSTARAMKRAREVGMRKVLGAVKSNLVFQFLGEAIVVASLAIVTAFLFFEMARPLFYHILGTDISFSYVDNFGFVIGLVGAGLLTGLLAGSYPAFYLSSFQPVEVLKSQTQGRGNATFRKVLTVLQFSIAIFMIVGTVSVYKQMHFMKNTDLGYNQEQVFHFDCPGPLRDKFSFFKQTLENHTDIEAVTISNGVPGNMYSHWSYKLENDGQKISTNINTLIMDYDFPKVFKLELVDGRWLSPDYGSDSTQGYLVNETAVKTLLLSNPIGTPIQSGASKSMGKIVGVVKDFHYKPMHHTVEPLVMRLDMNEVGRVAIRVGGANTSQTMAVIENEFKEIAPSYPFNFTFMDQGFDQMYKAESQTGTLLSVFSGLAIFVASLGLLGLVSFMAEQKKKEIGVRKVLGASVQNIVMMMSKDFMVLLCISLLISIPVSYFVINQWLEQFAYKTVIGFWVYALSGAITFLIAFGTIGFQSLKAASVNPTTTLRGE